jgi:hypothetical protein
LSPRLQAENENQKFQKNLFEREWDYTLEKKLDDE